MLDRFFPNVEAARGALLVLYMSTGGSTPGNRDLTVYNEILAAGSFQELTRIFETHFAYEGGTYKPGERYSYYAYGNVYIYRKKYGPEKLIRNYEQHDGKMIEV